MNPAAGVVMIQAELALAEYEAQPGIKLLRKHQGQILEFRMTPGVAMYAPKPRTSAEHARERLIQCLSMDRRNVPAFRWVLRRKKRSLVGMVPYDGYTTKKMLEWARPMYRWEQRL